MPLSLLQAHLAEVNTHWSLIAVPLQIVSSLLALHSAACHVVFTSLCEINVAHLIQENPSVANV